MKLGEIARIYFAASNNKIIPAEIYRLRDKFAFLTDEMLVLNTTLPSYCTIRVVNSIVTDALIEHLALFQRARGFESWCMLHGVEPIIIDYDVSQFRTLMSDATKLIVTVIDGSIYYVDVESLPSSYSDMYERWSDSIKNEVKSAILVQAQLEGYDLSALNLNLESLEKKLDVVRDFDVSSLENLSSVVTSNGLMSDKMSQFETAIGNILAVLTDLKARIESLPDTLQSAQELGETTGLDVSKLKELLNEITATQSMIRQQVASLVASSSDLCSAASVDEVHHKQEVILSRLTQLIEKDDTCTGEQKIVDQLTDCVKGVETNVLAKIDENKQYTASSNLLHSVLGALCK